MSSNGYNSALRALCEGNPPVTKASDAKLWYDVFFHLRLNKRLSKQSRRRWFEAPSRSLWRHYNAVLGGDGHKSVHQYVGVCNRILDWVSFSVVLFLDIFQDVIWYMYITKPNLVSNFWVRASIIFPTCWYYHFLSEYLIGYSLVWSRRVQHICHCS